MIVHRPADARGHANHGWLRAAHTFSFANYFDPDWMGFGSLRVLNQDSIAGGGGFPSHPHADMEIVTYVMRGALRHEDSMGNGDVIGPGDVQRMSAGAGVVHSEANASRTDEVHLLQMWVTPDRAGDTPGWEQRHFPASEKRNRLRLLVSPEQEDDALWIGADARLYAGLLGPGESLDITASPGRQLWLHLARGAMRAGERNLQAGDGLGLIPDTSGSSLELLLEGRPAGPADDGELAEFVVWDLPADRSGTP